MSADATSQPFSFRSALYVQTRLLDGIIHRLSHKGTSHALDEDVRSTIILMIQAMGSSAHSILKLTEKPSLAIRDCYGIARSIPELAVNICCICAAGRDAAQTAKRHALQRSYRDLDRSDTIAGIKIVLRRTNKPSPEAIDGLSEALEEFTHRSGREKKSWIDLDVKQRIETINVTHPQVALSLSASTFSIYRHASEILHGTYAGLQFFWKLNEGPPRTRDEAERLLDEHFTTIFTSAFFSLNAVIEMTSGDARAADTLAVAKNLMTMALEHVEALAAEVDDDAGARLRKPEEP